MKASRFQVFVFSFLISVHAVHSQAPPTFAVSKTAYDEAKRSLDTHAKYVSNLPGVRNGSTPLFYLHPPGSKVYGTVLIFHGYNQNAAASAIQARFLYSKKFNVVAFNLAGFAQVPEFWISAYLRKSAGYDRIRQALLNDSITAPLIAKFKMLGTPEEQFSFRKSLKEDIVPKIFASLKRTLTREEYIVAERALSLLQPGLTRTGMEKEAKNYFISGHQIFESDPFQKLQLAQALPGPVYAIGYSFGGVAVLNLAARSKVISKAVLLAPFLGHGTDKKREDFIHYGNIISALDLYAVRSSGPVPVELPGRSLVASTLAASLVNRNVITNSVRESTKTLCVIAEDDSVVDVTHVLEVCRSKLAGKMFVYPKSLKLDHFITPETGSKYGNAMLEQIANFLSTGNVADRKLLIPN